MLCNNAGLNYLKATEDIPGGTKTVPLTSLGQISAKRSVTVKSSATLAAIFLNIFAENYTNIWFESNAIGVSFMHTRPIRLSRGMKYWPLLRV